MATPLLIGWLVFVSIVGLNLIAAGGAAILHAWRSGLRRGGRTFLASALAGFLSASWLMSLSLVGSVGEETWVLIGVFGAFLAVATIVSVPGALLVARKLQKPGDDYQVFE